MKKIIIEPTKMNIPYQGTPLEEHNMEWFRKQAPPNERNIIYQYRPAYFSGFEQEVVEFNSLVELFNIPFVKRFSEDKSFIRYSRTKDGLYLFAEYKKGKKWQRWCVGFFKNNNDEIFNGIPILRTH